MEAEKTIKTAVKITKNGYRELKYRVQAMMLILIFA